MCFVTCYLLRFLLSCVINYSVPAIYQEGESPIYILYDSKRQLTIASYYLLPIIICNDNDDSGRKEGPKKKKKKKRKEKEVVCIYYFFIRTKLIQDRSPYISQISLHVG